jgi:hemerythrin-like metal-binding protein
VQDHAQSEEIASMASQHQVYAKTGFAPIDDEHEAISLALEALVDKMNGGDVGEVRQALDGVIRGVASHFSHEEGLMAEVAYSRRKRHEEAHALFVADAKKMQAEFEGNGVTANFRRWAVGRLPDWFRYHILAHDMGLAQYVLKSGVTSAVE